MTLTNIALFAAAAILYRVLVPARWRGWALLIGSVAAIYWLQPALSITPLDFILPTATLAFGVVGWLLTATTYSREDGITLGIVVGIVLALAIVPSGIAHSAPPVIDTLITLVSFGVLVVALGAVIGNRPGDRQKAIPALILLILVVFVVLKSDPLTLAFSAWIRQQIGRPLALAAVSDVGWLVFSYVAFRLIHTLRDRQTGKLPALTLLEYLTYVIFFPAYTAGPIDRAERFVKDYRAIPQDGPSPLPSFLAEAQQSINRLLRRTPGPALENVTTTAPNATAYQPLPPFTPPLPI